MDRSMKKEFQPRSYKQVQEVIFSRKKVTVYTQLVFNNNQNIKTYLRNI